MSSPPVRCPACHKPTRSGARFCPGCGKQLTDDAQRRESRAVSAAALVYIGVFVAIGVVHFAGPELIWTAQSELLWTTASYTIMAGFGALALALLGREAWRESLAGAADARALGLGLASGLAAFGLSAAYVSLLVAISGGEPESWELEGSLALVLISSVLLPALVEEWLDRGVLWVALSRITTPKTTIFASALLFGLSHGLNGAALFEVPHRFAVGLILGWLRHRTGSLWPPILAHATLNTLAVLL